MPNKITIDLYPNEQLTLFSVPDLDIYDAEYEELPRNVQEILEGRFGFA